MSDLSDNLKLTLLNTGEAVGDWGNITNNNLKEIEQAITSSYTLDMKPSAGGAWAESKILTIDSSLGANARNMAILVTSSSTTAPVNNSTFYITVPNVKKLYLFKLSTDITSPATQSWVQAAYDSNQYVYVKTSIGTQTVKINYQAGYTTGDITEFYAYPNFVAVYCDGTDVYPLNSAGLTDLTSGNVFGILNTNNGGMGRNTFSNANELLMSSNTSILNTVSANNATNQVLRCATALGAPAWGKVNLSTDVTNFLPIASGGTGSTSAISAGRVIYSNGTSYIGTAVGTTGQVLTSNGTGAPTWNTVSSGGITSVSGTAGRVTTSTVSGAVTVDLASGVVTAGSVGSAAAIPVIAYDTYGRITSVSTAANPQGTVTSVSGTAGRISVGGTAAAPIIDLASGVITAGSVGGSSAIPVIAYDTYGRITSVSTAAPTIGGTVGVANGGTGATTFTAGIVTSSGGTTVLSTVTAPSGAIVGTTDTQTLSNKRITPRTSSTSSQAASYSFNSDSLDGASINGVGAGVTAITFSTDGGSPSDQQKFTFKLYLPANITLAWTSGTKGFRAAGVTLPSTSGTTANKALYVGCIYNSTESLWDVIAVTQVA